MDFTYYPQMNICQALVKFYSYIRPCTYLPKCQDYASHNYKGNHWTGISINYSLRKIRKANNINFHGVRTICEMVFECVLLCKYLMIVSLSHNPYFIVKQHAQNWFTINYKPCWSGVLILWQYSIEFWCCKCFELFSWNWQIATQLNWQATSHFIAYITVGVS